MSQCSLHRRLLGICCTCALRGSCERSLQTQSKQAQPPLLIGATQSPTPKKRNVRIPYGRCGKQIGKPPQQPHGPSIQFEVNGPFHPYQLTPLMNSWPSWPHPQTPGRLVSTGQVFLPGRRYLPPPNPRISWPVITSSFYSRQIRRLLCGW